ncbi:MAG: MgtC/SapB family protein [Proteobacteria bacterium]|nr:MgtC/SapB family protein [Pseudomonadota bacterium]
MDPTVSLFGDFAIALFIGGLVGAEREHSVRSNGELLGGLRTFVLIAEAGAVAAWLGVELASPWPFLVGFAAVGGMAIVGPLARRPDRTLGLTTQFAMLVVYLLGGAVLFGHADVAVGLAIVTTLVLALKRPLHGAIAKLGDEDVLAGLQLLFATFIVLPLLPRSAIDPWGALVPYDLWWLVILIASISLVGYIAVRTLGETRGHSASGFFGGLVSSTAVTVALARRSKEAPEQWRVLGIGVLLAWTTMGVRVLVEVAVVEPSLLRMLTVPVLAATVPVAAVAGLQLRAVQASNGSEEPVRPQLNNPFSLWFGIRFAALFAAVLLAVRLAEVYASSSGVLAVAALAGATDVDAITLSLAQSAGTDLTPLIASVGILLAVIANTAVKLGIAAMLGGPRFRRVVATAAAASVLGAAAGIGVLVQIAG